jgi:hypothetical protein
VLCVDLMPLAPKTAKAGLRGKVVEGRLVVLALDYVQTHTRAVAVEQGAFHIGG